jgi:hypothetical protein
MIASYYNRVKLIFSFVILILIGFILFTLSPLNVSADAIITSSVRISVCGDLAKEGSEDCDNSDLDSQTCRTRGYDDGLLICDVACNFDESNCYGTAPSPTPTPTPVATSDSSDTSTDDSDDQSTQSTQTLKTNLILIPTYTITHEAVVARPLLPFLVSYFDPNKDGILSKSELKIVVENWIDEWVSIKSNKVLPNDSSCDLNEDSSCDLIDLSILLYHMSEGD